MSFSLSRGKTLDVTGVGLAWNDLPPADSGVIDLRSWFPDRAAPLELEIGSGKGTFLANQAAATPGVNYIGIEYAGAFWRYAADRLRRAGLPNVKLLHYEAASFVRQFCGDGVFRQVHIYFPDPWPKKRHHKRRLVQGPFLAQLHRVLEPAGRVRLATDHAEYFAWMQEHVAGVADLFEVLPFDSPASAGEGELVGTNFERKYRREGRSFHAMVLRRREVPAG